MTESNHLQNTPPDEANAKPIIPEPSPRYKKDENGENQNVETTEDKLGHTGETISEGTDEKISHFQISIRMRGNASQTTCNNLPINHQ